MAKRLTNSLVDKLKPTKRPYEVPDEIMKGLVVRVEPGGTKTFFLRYRFKRKQTRTKLGRADVLTVAQARDKAREALVGLTGGADPAEARREAKRHTLRSFLAEEYGPWMAAHRKTGTYQVKRVEVAFVDFLDKGLDELTAFGIENWRKRALKDGTKAATCNRNLAALKAALSRAVEWDLLEVNPLAKMKLLREEGGKKVRYLEAEEEVRLLAALDAREERMRKERDSANVWREKRGHPLLCDLRTVPFADHIKPMILVSLNTGVRRGELFSIEWDDVDFKRGLLVVRGAVAKDAETRFIPLNSTALEVFTAWRSQSPGEGLVFQNPATGQRFDNVNKAWRAVLKEAKIDGFRWHDQRHSFASRLVMSGADLNTVRELLGHSDIKMTLRYSHLSPEHKAQAVERLVSHPNVVSFKEAAKERG